MRMIANGVGSRTRALDVADDATGGVVHELDADLGHTATRACSKMVVSRAVLAQIYRIFDVWRERGSKRGGRW